MINVWTSRKKMDFQSINQDPDLSLSIGILFYLFEYEFLFYWGHLQFEYVCLVYNQYSAQYSYIRFIRPPNTKYKMQNRQPLHSLKSIHRKYVEGALFNQIPSYSYRDSYTIMDSSEIDAHSSCLVILETGICMLSFRIRNAYLAMDTH